MAVAWSPHGTLLATGSIADPTHNQVQVWDVATGRPHFRVTTRFSGGEFHNLGWSPDGHYLVGGAID